MTYQDFEQNILFSLNRLNINVTERLCLGVAVSGGADSISLLTALYRSLGTNVILKAVTVNHNIRSEEESGGDADFVESYCKKLNVPCIRYNLERNQVFEEALKRDCGIEEAARKLRYKIFDDFIEIEKIDFLCLAHNENDQNETVLMRLFQGSGVQGLIGIPERRGKFIRPLINICRNDVESYLQELNISYRTDKTNFENSMLRNNIRNEIVPVLNQKLAGWKKGPVASSKKLNLDNSFIEEMVCKSIKDLIEAGNFIYPENIKIIWETENLTSEFDFFNYSTGRFSFNTKDKISLNRQKFIELHKAVQIRIFYKLIEAVGAEKRISYQFIDDIVNKINSNLESANSAGGLNFILTENFIEIGKNVKVATEEVFFVTINQENDYQIGNRLISVFQVNNGIQLSCDSFFVFLDKLKFPFAIRSWQSGDEILSIDKDGKRTYKSVSKILDNWKCSDLKRKIPLIQQLCVNEENSSQSLCCIWGELYGYKNWIVKN